jgi:hypothetical protein
MTQLVHVENTQQGLWYGVLLTLVILVISGIARYLLKDKYLTHCDENTPNHWLLALDLIGFFCALSCGAIGVLSAVYLTLTTSAHYYSALSGVIIGFVLLWLALFDIGLTLKRSWYKTRKYHQKKTFFLFIWIGEILGVALRIGEGWLDRVDRNLKTRTALSQERQKELAQEEATLAQRQATAESELALLEAKKSTPNGNGEPEVTEDGSTELVKEEA